MLDKRDNQGSVLVAVLWCLVLLSVIVLGLLHTTRMDLRLVKNYGDRIQAHYLALAGMEKAKAVLYHDCVTRRQTGKNHTGTVYDDPKDFREIPLGRGRFSVLRPPGKDESGPVVYGVSDEESRLNINTASTNEFSQLIGMTADVMAAIIDWRSGTNQAQPGGAERDYYEGLQPPYEPRNAPFQTIRELLMVRGVNRDLLLGEETAEETPEELSSELGGFLNSGWAAEFTALSTDKNVSADGKDRINIQNADETALTGVEGITPTIARAIVNFPGRQQFQSVANLLDVKLPQQGDTNPNNTNGAAALNQQLFQQTADRFTAGTDTDQAGLININTAGLLVLQCLPRVDATLARAIISHRQSNGYFANVAGLLDLSGVTREIFKDLAPLVTARSETYRIVSEGRIASSGARQRIEEIVHISAHEMRLLSYREDL